MYLKSIDGNVIFEGYFHTIKRAIEAAIRENVCLDNIDLRYANLSQANLDSAQMKGACLWGVNLTGVNMSGVEMAGADCRNANFKDCCLAESDCSYVDFRGSYFSCTLLRQADLSYTKFSCPSIFKNNLQEAKILKGAVYNHRGEDDCDLSQAPIVISGAEKPIILFKDKILIGHFLYDKGIYQKIITHFLKPIKKENNIQF